MAKEEKFHRKEKKKPKKAPSRRGDVRRITQLAAGTDLHMPPKKQLADGDITMDASQNGVENHRRP